jgi:dihydroflavonol-4-reductase
MMTNPEMMRIAAEAAGVAPPRRVVSIPVLYAMAAMGSLRARLRGRHEQLTLRSLQLMRAEHEVDHGKAVRELGWQPRPVEDAIRAGARSFVELRAARRKAKAAQAD